MFGTGLNNIKLQEMTEEAREYVENELQQQKSQQTWQSPTELLAK